MSSQIIGYSSPHGYPAVRGHLVVEVAIILRIPTCPICGAEHRFVLADAAWAAHQTSLWLVTCPLAEPKQKFLVRTMSTSACVAVRQGEEVAAQTQLGKTWERGLTWALASYRTELGILINDTAERLDSTATGESDQESVD